MQGEYSIKRFDPLSTFVMIQRYSGALACYEPPPLRLPGCGIVFSVLVLLGCGVVFPLVLILNPMGFHHSWAGLCIFGEGPTSSLPELPAILPSKVH